MIHHNQKTDIQIKKSNSWNQDRNKTEYSQTM